jgi:tetratricopeptide (TPR) repeat protein
VSPPVIIGLLVGGIAILTLAVVSLSRREGKTGGSNGRKRGKDKAARVKEANRALAQNPRNAQALNTLADVYYSEQDWSRAASTYSILSGLVPTNPDLNEHEINLRHGIASAQTGDTQGAYKSLMLARQGHEDQFEINYHLGQIELKRKSYERAAGLLKAAYTARPDHPETVRGLGQALFRMKRPKDAISLLRRVIEAHPDDKESAFLLGQAYYDAGQQELATKTFEHLRPHPTYGPKACLMAGSMKLKARKYDDAEMDFSIGLKHEGVPPEILLELKYRLAATYSKQQRMDDAIAMLQEIAQMNPNYKDVTAQLGKTRELAGNRNLQVFMMAPTSEFIGLCRRMVAAYFPRSRAKVTDISTNRQEFTDITAEISTAKWEDTVLFRFVRTNNSIGELLLRDLYSRLKEVHAGRGLCITAGTFSDGARQFVEARLIDLIDKEDLDKLLKRV